MMLTNTAKAVKTNEMEPDNSKLQGCITMSTDTTKLADAFS